MDARQLLKVRQQYDARRRTLDPERYIAMEEFRDACSGALDMPPLGAGSPEDFFHDLLRVDARSILLKDFLAGAAPDAARYRELLGVDWAEYEALQAALCPVVQPVPERLVLMTFDDATIDHIEQAAPILEQYGGRGNFFVCEMATGMFGGPGFADKSLFMTWEQIRQLHDRGHEIVNHSMHHDSPRFLCADEAYLRGEVTGIDERCAAHGIPRPTAYGYPGGQCTARHERLLHEMGYLWARGDMNGDRFHRAGTAHYDPLTDSPLAMPSYNNAPMMTKQRLGEVVCAASGGRVAIFAYHAVTGGDFVHMSFEEQVAAIHALGGRCITFSELSQYIDPVRAYEYTHL